MNSVIRLAGLALVAVLAAEPAAVRAQGLFFVTSVSQPGGAAFVTADGATVELTVGRALGPGTVRVAESASVMLFGSPGAVVIVLGPATLDTARDEIRGATQLELRKGKLALFSTAAAGGGGVIEVATALGAPPGVAIDFQVVPGQTFVACTADRVALAYGAAQPPSSVAVNVNAVPSLLPTGQLLTVEATGTPRIAPLGNWLQEEGFVQEWGRRLGVESARESRADVEANLFHNIIAWDRYAGAGHVLPRLQPPRFSIEIRQTIQTVTTPARTTTRGGAIETQPFPGANEVPPVSPASASVQNLFNVGQGVTAILLNRNAGVLLSATGSQGLGFQGLQQLAIPGFSGGVRTTGPAGLGAQP
jgi:hypothetical protein